MLLCDGDVLQKNELKKGSVYDYLIKLDNFAFNNEAARKQSKTPPPSLLRRK